MSQFVSSRSISIYIYIYRRRQHATSILGEILWVVYSNVESKWTLCLEPCSQFSAKFKTSVDFSEQGIPLLCWFFASVVFSALAVSSIQFYHCLFRCLMAMMATLQHLMCKSIFSPPYSRMHPFQLQQKKL